jgi:hypothetical protein
VANDSNSLTLADYALQSNSPLVQKITYSMIMNGSVLQYMPFVNYRSMIANGVRFLGQGLGAVAFRAINDVPTVTKSTPTPYSEQAYIMSNNIAIDNVLLQDINAIQDPWAVQLGAFVKAWVYKCNDIFINNNHLTGDANAPVGLRYRLDNYADYGIPSEMKIDANVDISAGSNGIAFLEQLQILMDYMGSTDGTGIVLFMNDSTRRKIDRAVKAAGTAGGFDITKDQFGRRVAYYQNALIVDLGRKADQSTRIITSTETTAGADSTSNYSSIYGVRFGDEHFKAWQFKSFEEAVTGPYLLTASGTQQQVTIDYPFGWWQEDIRAIGRLYDIKTS